MDYPKDEHGRLLHPEYGYVICASNKKQPNRYGDYICLNHPSVGHERCHMHGSKSRRGAAHPNFRNGTRTKHMPTKLAARYEASLDDPDLMDIRRIAALRDAFITERLEALGNAPDPAQVWQEMTKQLNALEIAYSMSGDPNKAQQASAQMAQALRAMRALVSERTRYHQTRNEIESALNDQRKDITDYEGIVHKGEQAVSLDKLMVFIAQLHAILVASITDKRELNKVLNGVDTLLAIPDRVTTGVDGHSPAHNGNGQLPT